MTVLYAYGTLRTGKQDATLTTIRGRLFDLGSYPGLILNDPPHPDAVDVVLERIETDRRLDVFDLYEGYDPNEPTSSLYIRRQFLDGWVYEYNMSLFGHYRPIPSGDWLEHIKEKDVSYPLFGRFDL